MKCLRVFCMCCVISLICLSPSFALESSSSGESSIEYYEFEDVIDEQLLSTSEIDEPILVTVVDADAEYDVAAYSGDAPALVIGDTPPEDPLFYGSAWVTGYDSTLGTVTLYFPLSAKEDTFGVDSNGYLFNIDSSSVSGYLAGVYNNSVSASGFSYPRYRVSSSSSTYTYLYLTPTDSNMKIMTSMEPRQTVDDFVPYILVFMLGVVIVCFMKRS